MRQSCEALGSRICRVTSIFNIFVLSSVDTNLLVRVT